MPETKPETLAAGPYTSTETRTIKISGPIEITWTTKVDSSHVPATPVVSEDSVSDRLLEKLKPFVGMILSKLDDLSVPPIVDGEDPDREH